LQSWVRVPSTSDDLEQVLDELVDQEREQRPTFARAPTEPSTPYADGDTDPTVMVDPGLFLDAQRPIVCRPQSLHLARGTTPPPFQGVYCVVESIAEIDEREIVEDEDDGGS